jgi:hypothetical protein
MKTTEINTTQENILIAEFMGYEIQKDPTERFFGRYKTPITKVWIKENELSFDTDWNWLMEVVRKIEQLEDVYDFEEFLLIRDELCTGRIEESFYNIVDFIKWYNKQKN